MITRLINNKFQRFPDHRLHLWFYFETGNEALIYSSTRIFIRKDDLSIELLFFVEICKIAKQNVSIFNDDLR